MFTMSKHIFCGFFELKGTNFIIKDLPSVLILIIADQRLNDSLCWSDKYN